MSFAKGFILLLRNLQVEFCVRLSSQGNKAALNLDLKKGIYTMVKSCGLPSNSAPRLTLNAMTTACNRKPREFHTN